ncbi:MAG: SAM-dependent methyltransferase [Candidatus Bathyarchaeota archaeon]|nr:SAM-dependent methyltransferase [Candidatus Bathyarchaeota archaeon]MDH5788148.1 SAM-dependent methyltransferase [Candidatus Bathyarchaeota archaeon]
MYTIEKAKQLKDNSRIKRLNHHDLLKKVVLMPHTTETDAYAWVKRDLKEKGWDVRNPARHPHGEVYTQNEVFSHEELRRQLEGSQPENVVKVEEAHFWVIEAKREHTQLQQALNEAKEYANSINRSQTIRAIVVSGVAGNEYDGYITRSAFFDGNEFRPITINGREVSGLLQKEIAKKIARENTPDLEDVPIDKTLFLSKAEKINEILHLGAINKNYRARVMASLLLSLVDETPPNRNNPPSVLIGEINSRASRVLRLQGKGNFADFIEIALPPTEDNHAKFRNALVQTMQELDSLEIRSAMNSGTDVLGEFYEVFLKYGNGAKEIGIVLTPRHITKFAAEVLNIALQDIVYDPTCGTGGFLVAALDYVKRNANEIQLNRFKQNNVFGIDQEPEVVALALVNMIFRGDGKTNITEGNCFQKNLKTAIIDGQPSARYVSVEESNENQEPITKVLMNPPFALKTSDEKEYKFINHALKQMQSGGVLFSVLPSSIMIKGGRVLAWRRQLLQQNTLLAVITFPHDLFYPIGQHTIGVFVKKGIPHPRNQNVFWIRAINDGLLKKKGKRLPNPRASNDLETIKNDLKSFLANPDVQIVNIPEFQKACPIDFSDRHLELVPEAYLDSKIPNNQEIEEGIEQLIRQSVAYMIKSKREITVNG